MAARNLIVCSLLMCLAVSTFAQDITLLLQNRELVNREIGCVLQRNACDLIGKQIKGEFLDSFLFFFFCGVYCRMGIF